MKEAMMILAHQKEEFSCSDFDKDFMEDMKNNNDNSKEYYYMDDDNQALILSFTEEEED